MAKEVYVEKLKASIDKDWRDPLWNAIAAFQGETFVTSGRGSRPGVTFTYSIKRSNRTGKETDELLISRKENGKTITRSTVDMAFKNALEIQRTEGFVKGPKRLKVFGASYLYAIFVEWGLISTKCTV